MLSISNFEKRYPGTADPVISIPQLELPAGIYWIKGENGSGKTSIIKSVAGLLPFKGNIAVNGLDIIKNRMAYSRIVNYAEAEPQFPAFLSGKELINFYAAAKGAACPLPFLQQLGVHKFMQSKTGVYSSGMVKKLSLVLAFTGNPALILLDEPLIALDVAAVDLLQQTISDFYLKGTSFIITSHQPLNRDLLAFTGSYIIHNKTLALQQ